MKRSFSLNHALAAMRRQEMRAESAREKAMDDAWANRPIRPERTAEEIAKERASFEEWFYGPREERRDA